MTQLKQKHVFLLNYLLLTYACSYTFSVRRLWRRHWKVMTVSQLPASMFSSTDSDIIIIIDLTKCILKPLL